MNDSPKPPYLDGMRPRPSGQSERSGGLSTTTSNGPDNGHANRQESVPDLPKTTFEQPPGRVDSEPASTGERQKKSRKLFTKKRVLIGASTLFAVIIVVAGLIAWLLYKNLIADSSGGSVALQDQVDPTQLRGEGDGRVNIVFLGIDDAADLSDTILLMSLDPIAKDVALLSIPRDLYVDIPGFGSAKINAAHAYGERYGYDGGGPALVKDTLEEILAIPIHYYGRVNFAGFEKAIDTVGGVEVEVEESLTDYMFPNDATGGYSPFHVDTGTHHMDGVMALKYARSRYSTSDFDRSRRQQQILMALKDRTLSAGTLSNPIKVGGLLRTLSSNARTDLQIDEIMRLLEIAEEVDEGSVVLSQLDASEDNFLSFSNVYGQSVLVPTSGDFSQIQEYVRGLLVDSYIKNEAARISVLNGTTREGLAGEVGKLLRSFGYKVDNVDNASEQNYTRTVIFDYSGSNPYTLRYLEQRFGVTAQRRSAPTGRQHIDIEVVVGSNYELQDR